MSMRCIFGFAFDGRVHPEHVGGGGDVDVAIVGPRGLLELLAVRLGLGRAPAPAVLRTAAWLRKLETASASVPCFWTSSLAVAPWACAETLLGMRDELVEAGWNASDGPDRSRRLSDLALAETTGPALPGGHADLMRDVIDALEAGARPTDLALVEIVDVREDVPPAWLRLLDLLACSGIEVRRHRRPDPVRVPSDLGLLRTHLADGRTGDFAGDGTFAVFETRNELAAAEAVADWIRAGSATPPTSRVAIVAENGDTRVLDGSLRRRGLPILGLAPADRNRGALALLPLAIAVRMAPANAQAVIDLLSQPRPPIRKWAARLLVSALRRQPAFEGRAWAEAWAAVDDRLVGEHGAEEAERILADWRGWFEVGTWDPRGSIATGDALNLCGRVADWAVAADAGVGDPLVLVVRQAATELASSVRALRCDRLETALFEDMVGSAVAAGVRDPNRRPEAGSLRAVDDAGAVWGPVETVVWWRFASQPHDRRTPWRRSEIAALEERNVHLDPPGAAEGRRQAGWARLLRNATGRLVLVEPAYDRGSALGRHPLGLGFASLLAYGTNAGRVRIDVADALAGGPLVALAGREVLRIPSERLGQASARSSWTLPAGLRSISPARVESASSLEDLVTCQWRWTLRHVLHLRAADAFALPSTERLLGDLAHELARTALPVGTAIDPEKVSERTRTGFAPVLAATAVPLLHPALAAELVFARRRIPEALVRLGRLLREAGCVIEGVEVPLEGTLDGIDVRSRIDILIRDGEGRRSIVDLKWTAADGLRREEVERGGAVQLATYARLVGLDAGAAYYLLRSRGFAAVSRSQGLFEASDAAKTLDEVWSDVSSDWTWLREGFARGVAVARGAGGKGHRPFATPAPPAPCRFCGYRVLCRVDAAGTPR